MIRVEIREFKDIEIVFMTDDGQRVRLTNEGVVERTEHASCAIIQKDDKGVAKITEFAKSKKVSWKTDY